MTQHDARNRPVRALTAAGLCLMLLGLLFQQTFGPFDWLGAPKAAAVGGYDAVHVLGPNDFVGTPTWEFVFIPASTVEELTYDEANDVIYGTGGNLVYRCDTATLCDEETDWATYSIGAFQHESITIDPVNQTLYVGNTADPAELYRCDITATDCDDSADWVGPVMTFDFFAGSEHVEALIVANGFLFVGAQAFFNDSFFYSCDTSTGCDDSGDFAPVLGDHGGRIQRFGFDPASGIVFAGHSDSDGVGYLLICPMSSGCNEDTDWVDGPAPGINSPVVAFAMDEDNGIMYVGSRTSSGEAGERPATINRCDTSTGCDDGGDWELVYGGFVGATSIDSLHWEPNSGVLYAGTGGGPLLRCDAGATDCNEDADWRMADPSAGQSAFAQDTDNAVLHSLGDGVYRCELSTGCALANELDQTDGVAYDQGGERFFVSDYNRNRVLIYDLSDGLDDGEEPVNVLGQTDFSGVDCNDGNGVGSPLNYTLCTPQGLAYDETNDRLFVNDYNNNRTMVFDLSGPVTDGMAASFVLGQPDFTTADCETDQTSLCGLQNGVVYDNDGFTQRLFVADAGNRRVMVFDVNPGTISDGEPAINVIGAPDYTTDPGSCSINRATTCLPFGLALNGDDQVLFVSDSSAQRVTTFAVDTATLVPNDSGSDGPDAINVLGQDNFTSAGCDTSATGMCNPNGMSYDSAGNRLFVSEQGNNRVIQFDTTTIEDGEPAVDVYGQDDLDSAAEDTTQSSLTIPHDAVYMADLDYIAISDSENHRIMFFEAQPNGGGGGNPTGGHEATDLLGELTGSNTPNFDKNGSNNGPNDKGLFFPHDFAVDPNNHRLFLSDGANGRVMEFDLDASDHLIDHVADHLLGSDDLFANTGGCSDTKIVDPHGLAYDSTTDRLFMSDSCGSGRIVVWDLSGGLTDTMAATWVLGAGDFDGTEGPTSQSDVNRPSYMALDEAGQRLFVGDPGNARVLVFDIADITSGEDAINVLGQEDFDSNTPGLDQDSLGFSSGFIEMGLAYDSNNDRLFVGDLANHRTMVFDVNPGTITDGEDADNVLGQPNFFTDTCATSQTGQCEPVDAAYDDATDRLFVSDSNNTRVLVYNLAGGISDGMGATNVIGEEDFDTNTSQTTQDGFAEMRGILFDPVADYLYVAEFGNVRGMIFDVTTVDDGEDAVDMVGQLDDAGNPKYSKNGANNGPNRWGYNSLQAVALDTVHHRLFAAEFSNRVLVYNLTTANRLDDHLPDNILGQPDYSSNAATEGASGFSNGPVALAYDSDQDRLFVGDANGNRVMVFDTATITDNEPAVHVLGQPDLATHNCCTVDQNEFISTIVTFDRANQRLFLADNGDNRVLVFDVATIDDGEDAINVLGQPDFFTSTAATTQVGFNNPSGVIWAPDIETLFVTDSDNNRVMVFDLSGGISDGMPASNVLGQDDFISNGNATSQSGFNNPFGGTYDSDTNRLFVGDRFNNRVMVFDVASIDDGEDAVDAYGQGSFTSADCNTSRSGLCSPQGNFDFDTASNTLWVADTGNNRVLAFGPATGGGGPQPTPEPIGFTPGRIIINRDDPETDSRNVLVSVYAQTTNNFTGVVDVLLSNTTDFSTFVPFRYVIPERLPNGSTTRDIWPKTIAWDLCFGLTDTSSCSLGNKIVYARFYVNVPPPIPVLVPTPAVNP